LAKLPTPKDDDAVYVSLGTAKIASTRRGRERAPSAGYHCPKTKISAHHQEEIN
jgi:hypothetical protein